MDLEKGTSMSKKKTMTTRLDVTGLDIDELQNELKKHIQAYREEGWHYSGSFPVDWFVDPPKDQRGDTNKVPTVRKWLINIFCE